jgi:hypothetical protein
MSINKQHMGHCLVQFIELVSSDAELRAQQTYGKVVNYPLNKKLNMMYKFKSCKTFSK